MQSVKVSDRFRKNATRSLLALLAFLLFYIVLVGAALAASVMLAGFGIGLVLMAPSLLSVLACLALCAAGFLLLFFLIKFIFKWEKTDLGHYTEITAAEEPQLFALIKEIVEQTGTDFPKKVYLSTEVNASVFYASPFWSMFLPVRKNLHIGLGLVNATSVSELKAILAHEFGHFSQRSMKLGSYISNVNKIVYNILYENSSIEKVAAGLASIHWVTGLAVMLSFKTMNGVQWILSQMYIVLNKSYMSLSREMEFHADSVAVHVAGTQPIISSLLRLELASHTYNRLLEFYNERISENKVAGNLFEQHHYLNQKYAEENGISIVEGLPLITEEFVARYNYSRLVVKDQWASHPTNSERFAHVRSLQVQEQTPDLRSAWTLFQNPQQLMLTSTDRLFARVEYTGSKVVTDLPEFIAGYTKAHEENSFSKRFKGYFNERDYPDHDPVAAFIPDAAPESGELFTDDIIETTRYAHSLQADIETLKQIADKKSGIKTFDFDGRKYTRKEALTLASWLGKELDEHISKLNGHDKKITAYFLWQAKHRGDSEQYRILWAQYTKVNERFAAHMQTLNQLIEAAGFFQQNIQSEDIPRLIGNLSNKEKALRQAINKMSSDEAFTKDIDPGLLEQVRQFHDKTLIYIVGNSYMQDNVQRLYTTINNYYRWINLACFLRKKNFLDYLAGL